jgi:hypothetical protein
MAVMLASSMVYGQSQSRFQQIPWVESADATVEPVSVEPVSVESITVESVGVGDVSTANDRFEQVEAEIVEVERFAVDFASAFEKAQRQFVEGIPGQQAVVPQRVLERFEHDLDELERRFTRIGLGFDELGRPRRAERTREALGALEVLQAQLALLGLRLETRGERARVANALEFDFQLLLTALAALKTPRALGRPVVLGDREFDADIIRPPEGVTPAGVLIRPPKGIEPSREIIRPPQGIEPSDEIIRPPEPIEQPDDIIRPPTSDNPAVSE